MRISAHGLTFVGEPVGGATEWFTLGAHRTVGS